MATKPIKLPKDTKGNEYYPATTTDAVVDRSRVKSMAEILDEIDSSLGSKVGLDEYAQSLNAKADKATVEAAINELTNAIPEVVNDLTTGGADKALSAEMGKRLAREATLNSDGLMSAEDKITLVNMSGVLYNSAASEGDILFNSSVVNVRDCIECTVDKLYSSGGLGYYDSEDNLMSSVTFTDNTMVLSHIPEGFSYAKKIWTGDFESLVIKKSTKLEGLGDTIDTFFNKDVIFIEGKYLTFTGQVSTPYAGSYYSEYYPISKSNKIIYSGRSQYGAAACVFLDSEKNVISTVPTTTGDKITYDEKVIDVPDNACFVRFGSITIKPSTRIESFFASTDLVEELKETIAIQEVPAIQGNYLQFEGTISDAYDTGYYSDFVRVSELKQFRYTGTVQYQVAAWCLYDRNKNKIESYPTKSQSTKLVINNEIIPTGDAVYIRFGSIYQPFVVQTSLKGYVVDKDIDNIQNQVDNIQNQVDSISFPESALHSKSVIWVGDSITEGSVRMTPSFGGWAKIIADRNLMQSTNYGIGGACITHIEGKTNAIVDRLQNYSKDVDYCIVQGGLNDTAQAGEILGEITNGYTAQLNTSTYCGAMEFICKYLATNYSDKKYGFIVTFQISSTKWNTTWGDKTVEILKKWGIPYIDLRYCAGFNLASPDMRKFFGTYIGDVALYDSTKGYVLDEQVKYEGALYKANVAIPAPAGEFDVSKWILQESDNANDYDDWHCNILGYKKLADVIEAWMKTL